jgi:hypothetical protein
MSEDENYGYVVPGGNKTYHFAAHCSSLSNKPELYKVPLDKLISHKLTVCSNCEMYGDIFIKEAKALKSKNIIPA